MIEREGALENVEVEFSRPDGRTVWCVLSSQIICDAAGKIDHYEGVSWTSPSASTPRKS